jgi:hypothetical protein
MVEHFVKIQWGNGTFVCMMNSNETCEIYLGVDESSKNCNGSSERVDGLDRRLEDDDGRDNDRNPLHGVPNAECQR